MRRLLPALLLLTLAGCGQNEGAASSATTVVATTNHAADLASNVTGEQVTSLLPANADPHDYEVRPQDVQALAEADLIVRSGGELDEWLGEAIEGAGSDAPVVTLMDSVQTIGDDPHWWHDPRNAVLAVEAIRDALPAPGRADAYIAELRELDAEIAACIERIPPQQRKLVTTHDALGYYAQRYGLEVVGAVIPSQSTAGQPSAGETAALVETIREQGVEAVFAESSVDAKVEQAIAREAGARLGDPLFADTLGPGMSYVESMRANTEAIADGLGAPCS